ncbi:hypothetical protein [Methylocystis parvus]|uniref:Uncharacterized protein n=1 Tax=Methylocystis parvus TaxID=134 RepID=A0A6B8MB60_9HYPH|nr:hypothetical protein [Methylocystis parvus]QGM99926.1 hypothetical protein F7D14_20260 [Methylocystis parvus]WBK02347.1 hypothetical protein MMG94_20105 [Methylocystis parvus OBBP]
MGNDIDSRERFRTLKIVEAPTHKFELGVHVVCKPGPFAANGYFRVTRHLPDGGYGLQYRIRSDRDGHERVVAENALERAT